MVKTKKKRDRVRSSACTNRGGEKKKRKPLKIGVKGGDDPTASKRGKGRGGHPTYLPLIREDLLIVRKKKRNMPGEERKKERTLSKEKGGSPRLLEGGKKGGNEQSAVRKREEKKPSS